MGVNTEIQVWLINSMFVLGILIVVLGLWIIFLPRHFLRVGQSMGKWISTDRYFESLDRPRYQERFIYKHHQIVGALIVAGSLYTLVILISIDFARISAALPVLVSHLMSEWIYVSLYYLLLGANLMALLIGGLVFIRPSLLKRVEESLNRWIGIDENLKKLDETHEIAIDILPGNPRLFGIAVMLGGVYIVLSMGIMLL